MRLGSATRVLVVVSVLTGVNPVSRAESVLCRLDCIHGFEKLCGCAMMLLGAPTSDLAEARVFVSAKSGFLYVHTNYTERLDVHPAKLATNEPGVRLDEAIARIIYSDPSRANMPLVKKSITLYLDKESCEESRYVLDCSSYANVKEISTKRIGQGKSLLPSPPDGQSPPENSALPPSGLSQFLAKNSSTGNHMFALENASGTSAILAFPSGRIEITLDELKTLGTGCALPKSHPLSKLLNADTGDMLLMYTPERLQSNNRLMSLARDISCGIQKSYPRCHVVRGLLSTTTFKTLASLENKTVSRPDDIVTVVDETSFSAADLVTVKNIEPSLRNRGFSNVVTLLKDSQAKFNYGTDRVIIVVTGHTGAELATFLSSLYEAGAFNENYVILDACNETLRDKTLETIMSGKRGAKAIFSQGGPVKVSVLPDALLGLAKRVADGQAHSLFDVIVRAFQMHNLDGVWSVCKRPTNLDSAMG